MRKVQCALLLAGIVQTGSGASISGNVNYWATFSSSSANVSFAAGSPGHSESNTIGFIGPKVTGSQSALGTDFGAAVPNGVSVDVFQNWTVPQISLSEATLIADALVAAFSGVVRVTNSGPATTFTIDATLIYTTYAIGPSLSQLGTATASQRIFAAIQFFDPQTGEWGFENVTGFDVDTDESRTDCQSGCPAGGTFEIGANTFVDVRLRGSLGGFVGVGIPEPMTFGLCGAALIAIAGLRLRQR